MTQKDIRKAARRDAMAGRTPYTIYEVLCAKLGRTPTSAELRADVKRIIREGAERAGK